MATTLNKLSEQVIWLLEKGAKPIDSKLNKQVIARELRQIIHKVIKGEWRQAQADDDKTVDSHYIATFKNITVQLDEDYDKCYSVLPAGYIYLYNHTGIQQVRPMTGDRNVDRPMIPINPGDSFLYDQLNSGREVLKGQWCYEPDRDKVWFTEKNGHKLTDAGIDKVEIKMVSIDPSDVEDTDTLPLPPELEHDVLMAALALHGYNPQEAADVITDGNPDRRQ